MVQKVGVRALAENISKLFHHGSNDPEVNRLSQSRCCESSSDMRTTNMEPRVETDPFRIEALGSGDGLSLHPASTAKTENLGRTPLPPQQETRGNPKKEKIS